ncbi:MAG TPA: hypothetical protein VHM26_09350 [Chitinophagaceae bacterium]|jgi:hypothetical protein|nr:hypothetical protein [Chitinophagaceae bacterium]
MKHFLMTLFSKAANMLEEDLATRDRSTLFRVTTLTLVATTAGFIIFYTIKSL